MERESEEAESRKPLLKKSSQHRHVEVRGRENEEEASFEQLEKVPALKSVPKRKLSVFYRSFDIITPESPSSVASKSVLQVKRSSSSPSVGGDDDDEAQKSRDRSCDSYVRARSQEPKKNASVEVPGQRSQEPKKNSSVEVPGQRSQEPKKNASVEVPGQRSQEPKKNASVEVPEQRSQEPKKNSSVEVLGPRNSPPRVKRLVRVGEGLKFEGYDYQKILSKFTGAKQDGDVNARCRRGSRSVSEQRDTSTTFAQRHIVPAAPVPILKQDPAETKDPSGPAGTGASRFDRKPRSRRFDSGEKALAREMSSRENSSCGSESEEEQRELAVRKRSGTESGRERRQLGDTEQAIEKTNYLHQCLISSQRNGLHVGQKVAAAAKSNCEDAPVKVVNGKQRKGIRAVERSLSEGDSRCWCKCSCSCECKGNCKCVAKRSFPQKVEDTVQAFPSLTDKRLRRSGITNLEGEDWSPYRENLAEGELERKYTAFSIGLGTDRVTLKRRMTLSLRQRDLSERNFTAEVQRMQQDIQELAVLCTDRDSIEKVERARHRLEMVARCSHRVSCAAETLGAVHQEQRISRAVLTADKYLQLLRARCENLAVELVELKRILAKNNIAIDETNGELGDELPRIRYRGGLPTNNRTMMARRRASIATISRPLVTPADAAKDAPRQRNSVSGRVTLRRPSLCFESPKWEVERFHLADSVTTAELRGISEQIESRRASLEEKEASLRNDRRTSLMAVDAGVEKVLVEAGCHVGELNHQINVIEKKSSLEVDDLECRIQEEPSSKCDLWLHVDQPLISNCALEKRRKTSSLCGRTSEHYLRINGKLLEWQSIVWSLFIFFLGFYVKHLTSEIDSDAALLKR